MLWIAHNTDAQKKLPEDDETLISPVVVCQNQSDIFKQCEMTVIKKYFRMEVIEWNDSAIPYYFQQNSRTAYTIIYKQH